MNVAETRADMIDLKLKESCRKALAGYRTRRSTNAPLTVLNLLMTGKVFPNGLLP